MSIRVGLVVRIVAKAGREEDVASFLSGALPLAQKEAFMPAWFAVRAEQAVFYIVDFFPEPSGREQHLSGPIAAALLAKAPELLAEPPRIERVDVLGAKLPRGD